MKRQSVIIALITCVAMALWILHNRQTKTTSNPGEASGLAVNAATAAGEAKANKTPVAMAPTAAPVSFPTPNNAPALPTDSQARASLQYMSATLNAAFRNSRNLDALMESLKRSGQNPFATRDGSEDAGYTFFIRTKNPLPGTRNFHAQYIDGSSTKVPVVENISFEFKPGPTAFRDAIQAAQQSFSVGKPVEETADFVKWKLDDTYNLWIKKKGLKDLRDNPFSAYDPKTDVGTVEMTVEVEIHGPEDDHGH